MKILKRIVIILCTSFLFFGITSCRKISDIAPKSYGEWDGNYIYAGNIRCKTTGEADEYLVKTLVKNNVEYYVEETIDFAYKDDNIYMCLSLRSEEEESDAVDCFVYYDIKEKTTDIIYWDLENYGIEYIYNLSETFAVLNMGNNSFLRVNYNGNVEPIHEYLNQLKQVGEYLIKFDYVTKTFLFRKWEETDYTVMFTVSDKVESNIEYVEEDGKKGFLVYTKAEEEKTWSKLYFYDIEKQSVFELLETNNVGDFFVKDCFIMTGEPEYREYVVFSPIYAFENGQFKMWEDTPLSIKLWYNCKLYRIDYKTMELILIYDFGNMNANCDFTDFVILDKETLYFSTEEIVFGGGILRRDKVEKKDYILNLHTGELKKTTRETYSDWLAKEKERRLIEESPSCGTYVYWFVQDSYGYMGRTYTLYRYDTEKDTFEAMQFWNIGENVEEDEDVIYRYSLKLKNVWETEALFDGIVDLNHTIIIRDY